MSPFPHATWVSWPVAVLSKEIRPSLRHLRSWGRAAPKPPSVQIGRDTDRQRPFLWPPSWRAWRPWAADRYGPERLSDKFAATTPCKQMTQEELADRAGLSSPPAARRPLLLGRLLRRGLLFPSIGRSISLWPAEAFRGRLALRGGFAG